MIGGVLARANRPPSGPRRPAAASAIVRDAEAWCGGRSWAWRAILLLYFAWAGWRQIRDPFAWSLFAGVNLGVHELGHVLFAFAGRFVGVAGGSLAQVAAPAAAGALLWRQRDFFGLSVAGAWEAFSIWNLATYVGDARSRELPLLGLTAEPIHDWNYLLSRLGLLAWDRGLAGVLRLAAFLLWAASLLWGAWLCRTMARRGRKPPLENPPGQRFRPGE